MMIELRKRQPITARPKTVNGVVNPVSLGLLCPPPGLNPSREWCFTVAQVSSVLEKKN